MEAASSLTSRLPQELFDRILDTLWSNTSLRIYASNHVVTIIYKASSNPSFRVPKWLLTSKFFLAAGLAQFRRHAVVTCIRPASHHPRPVHVHIGGDKLLLQSVKDIILDLAVRCREKQVVSNNHCHAHCDLMAREEYWDTLVPRMADTYSYVHSFVPGLEQLTLQIEVQLLDWMREPTSFSIALKEFMMLGARWKHVKIEVARPTFEYDDASTLHVGRVDALLTRVQTALAEMGTIFTHLHANEQQQFGRNMEKALDEVYKNSLCWNVWNGIRMPTEPTAMSARVEEFLHLRKRSSKSQRKTNDWIDADTGTWHLEISYTDAEATRKPREPSQSLKAPGLYSFFALKIRPNTPFCRDKLPRTGRISYSCDDSPALGFYVDGDESGMIDADNKPQIGPQPAEAIHVLAHRHSLKAPEREGGDVVTIWERGWWRCENY